MVTLKLLSVEEYLEFEKTSEIRLVSQISPFVILYKRVQEHWEDETLDGEGTIDIPCLGFSLTLERLYQGISFQDNESAQP